MDSGQSNRLFIMLAVAMIGLICIGLMGLGGVIYWTRSSRAQESAAVIPTATPIPPTFTPTSTFTATPTDTPLPTPTGTPVINNNGGEEATATPGEAEAPTDTPTPDLESTPTNTRVLQTPTETTTPTPTSSPAAEMPEGGGVLPASGNGFLIWAGVVLLVLLTVGVANHLRPSAPGD